MGETKPKEGAIVKKDVGPATIAQIFTKDYCLDAIKVAAPKHLDAERFLRIANTATAKNPKLLSCTVPSFWNCLIECSSMGIEPDGRNAHLLPFYNNKTKKVDCTLIVDYKGYIHILLNDENVTNVHGQLVCENDVFYYDPALNKVTEHSINFKEERGKPYAVYTCVKLVTGEPDFHVLPMSKVDETMKGSKGWKWAETGDKKKGGGKKDSTWHTHPDDMILKTCLRHHTKWLRLAPEAHASIEMDDKYLYDYGKQAHVTGEELNKVPSGGRTKLRPKPEEENIQEAETEDPAPADDGSDITVKIATLEDLDMKVIQEMCTELGIKYVAGEVMKNDATVCALYSLHQLKNEK